MDVAAILGPDNIRERKILVDGFSIAAKAVIPFVVYIGFGMGVRRTGLVDEPFLRKLNSVIFYCFYPIVSFCNIYGAGGDGIRLQFLALVVASVLVCIGLCMLAVPRFIKAPAQQGVVVQALYRSNILLFALPLVQSLFGEYASAAAGVMVTIVVPLYNVMAVIVLEYYRGCRPKLVPLLKKIFTNPLILGALAGGAFTLLGIRIPSVLEAPIHQLSALTTPLALFVLGGTLQFSSIREHLSCLTATLVCKLLVFPAVTLWLSGLLGLQPVERFLLLSVFATPVATASYPMAEAMDGDGKLAAEFVAISTVTSVVTLFFWLTFFARYL